MLDSEAKAMSQHGYGIVLQTATPRNAALLAALVAEISDPERKFRTDDLLRVFQAYRVPAPRVPTRLVGQMVSSNLLVPVGEVDLALTPFGRQQANSLLSDHSIPQSIEHSPIFGSDFANTQHDTIPPELAPAIMRGPIIRMLETFPFEQNVFLMTRYPREPWDQLHEVFMYIRKALTQHGLHLHLASDRQFGDDIWSNVNAYMWACKFGIGILESQSDNTGPNPNVLIELGGMLKTGRRCAILKDRTISRTPTDIVGFIYKSVNLRDSNQVSDSIHKWIGSDLAFGPCCDDCAAS